MCRRQPGAVSTICRMAPSTNTQTKDFYRHILDDVTVDKSILSLMIQSIVSSYVIVGGVGIYRVAYQMLQLQFLRKTFGSQKVNSKHSLGVIEKPLESVIFVIIVEHMFV